MAHAKGRSNKAVFWFLFAAGGTVVAFIMPVMVLVTGLGPLGLFDDAFLYENMHGFVSNWLVRLALFGIIVLMLWHAAHRLKVCAHDFGLRAEGPVSLVLYGLALIGTIATAMALLVV
ncbi:MAG: fumarate reductase subunit D [Rhodospirillales bacterium]|nr:fumarate reductase subunit D [Rhodospirillales bacterium]